MTGGCVNDALILHWWLFASALVLCLFVSFYRAIAEEEEEEDEEEKDEEEEEEEEEEMITKEKDQEKDRKPQPALEILQAKKNLRFMVHLVMAAFVQ